MIIHVSSFLKLFLQRNWSNKFTFLSFKFSEVFFFLFLHFLVHLFQFSTRCLLEICQMMRMQIKPFDFTIRIEHRLRKMWRLLVESRQIYNIILLHPWVVVLKIMIVFWQWNFIILIYRPNSIFVIQSIRIAHVLDQSILCIFPGIILNHSLWAARY